MIQPTYVTFEQAKYFYDRNIHIESNKYYNHPDYLDNNELLDGSIICNAEGLLYESRMSAPEQHVVVEWLRLNHNIWVYTYPVAPFISDDENYPKIVWVSKICSLNQLNFEKFIDADNGLAINHHYSPQEAYSVAFDYILKELI